ncbi:hypothetical protein EVAR_37848_1 [Eumeta japonica]|uniref:Uncharacterized protein n=1 Tax=Eumeta variegata TaxID=151549 RepID=A0A4C1X473_EUMVA|nr:hypothetical protein EVAR_37848_1 [Eumeta japonica]
MHDVCLVGVTNLSGMCALGSHRCSALVSRLSGKPSYSLLDSEYAAIRFSVQCCGCIHRPDLHYQFGRRHVRYNCATDRLGFCIFLATSGSARCRVAGSPLGAAAGGLVQQDGSSLAPARVPLDVTGYI